MADCPFRIRQVSELKQLLLDYGMVWVGHVASRDAGNSTDDTIDGADGAADDSLWQARRSAPHAPPHSRP